MTGTTPTTRGPGRPLRGLFGGKARLCRHSDWAGERPEMKSTSGGWLMCGTSLLRSWSSTQNTIALSAAEAELCATSKRAQHALHLKSMGEDFGVVVEPLIRRNASAALGIACRRGLAGKTRHVQVHRRCWVATSAHEVLPQAELERHIARMNYLYTNADLRVETSTMEFQHILELVRRLKYFNKYTALAPHSVNCGTRVLAQ